MNNRIDPIAPLECRKEHELAALCIGLMGYCGELSPFERKLAKEASTKRPDPGNLRRVREEILAGGDPLGEAFLSFRPAKERRASGAVYTPRAIVFSMIRWLSHQGSPARIVDPGAGSGRFILAAGKVFPKTHLLAIETDPLAALMLRANISVRGWTSRASVLVNDYREIRLPWCAGTTAFIGNPPYVRHHGIQGVWKKWYASKFATLGIKASSLAGLHLHFFLQTHLLAKKGDFGAFITSSEWLDVNYGSALRNLLLKEMGGLGIHVLEPTVEAFPSTITTASITCFRVGEPTVPVRVRAVKTLGHLNGLVAGVDVSRARLQNEGRWSAIIRPSLPTSGAEIELGEIFRVHRGQVTGANDIWIADEHALALPADVKLPTVTKAKELIEAGAKLGNADGLRKVIDLPADLSRFSPNERNNIRVFLSWAKIQGADQGYIARHRRAWWSVGLKPPAPILCTYMARRPPQFTLNACGARHINIAHGLYPREDVSPGLLATLVAWLNQNISTSCGRTYAGGLTKFEPKEIERLLIPRVESLLV